MHEEGITHRDIKPQNILVSKDTRGKIDCKICDFGVSVRLTSPDEKLHVGVGTPGYMAPEIYKHKPYRMTVDIWSLGILLYHIVTGSMPFYSTDRQEIKEKVLNDKIDFYSD